MRCRCSPWETATVAACGVGATEVPGFTTGSAAGVLDTGLTAGVSMVPHASEGDGISRPRRPLASLTEAAAHYRRSDSTFCGTELACATIAVPACCRIWARVRAAVSAAKSVSWIRLREAERFTETAWRLLIVESKRFWMVPSVRRSADTRARA